MKTPSPGEAFAHHTLSSLQSGSFVRLLLSSPVHPTQDAERIVGRLVIIKDRPMLSLTLKQPRQDVTRNLAFGEVAGWLKEQLAEGFRSALLETTEGTKQFAISPSGRARLISHRRRSGQIPSRDHDRKKASPLDESARPWLMGLGLCDESGRVRASAADKYRQLERYLEILGHLVRDCGWKPGEEIRITDMGSGKGYLTFGAWHLLRRTLKLDAKVVGIEVREELVSRGNDLARRVGADTLTFRAGEIATMEMEGTDALIALHACNTATDQAIARGVRAGAKLIVVSPCCHQEVRPKMGRPAPLAPLLAHGLMAERLGEWLTDGLRTLRLEEAGYETKVIEFVGSEHTPRNVLICGVRKAGPFDPGRVAGEVRLLKEFFHLDDIASDQIING